MQGSSRPLPVAGLEPASSAERLPTPVVGQPQRRKLVGDSIAGELWVAARTWKAPDLDDEPDSGSVEHSAARSADDLVLLADVPDRRLNWPVAHVTLAPSRAVMSIGLPASVSSTAD